MGACRPSLCDWPWTWAPCLIQTFAGMAHHEGRGDRFFTQHRLFMELPRIWGPDMSPPKDTSTEIKLVPKVGMQSDLKR